MGNFQNLILTEEEYGVRMCANVLVVASARYTDDLDWARDTDVFPGMTVLELDNSEPVPVEAAAKSALAVIEVDPHSSRCLNRIAELKQRLPDLPVIAAIPDASVALVRTLIREGVADVVSLPFSYAEVLETAVTAMSAQAKIRDHDRKLAPVVAVVRSTGGCGATTIASQLTAELATHLGADRGAILVDLDLQNGTVAEYLDCAGHGSIGDLLAAEDRLDDALIEAVTRQTGSGFKVIAAPEEIMPIEDVDTDRLLSVIDMLRQRHGAVVLDLPANWTNWSLSAALSASVILVVVELSIASLRQAKRRLDLFASVGIDPSNIAIVVNRVERRLFRTIDLGDVEATLGRPAIGRITADTGAIASAQGQGLAVSQVAGKSRFVAEVAAIAQDVCARIGLGGEN